MSPFLGSFLGASILSIVSIAVSTRLSPNVRLKRNDPRRDIALAAAILVGLLVLFSPLDALADRFFSAHMVVHELLLFTMPIALLAARPIPAVLMTPWRLLPSRWRRSIAKRWNWTRGSLVSFAYLERPFPALLMWTLVLWLWHAPRLYDLALRNEWVHTTEHILFLVTSLLYWQPLLSGCRRGALNNNPQRVLYLLAGGMQGCLLGALIAVDNNVLYTDYLLLPGLSVQVVLADQHLGGAIMWFTGPIFCGLLAAVALDNGDIRVAADRNEAPWSK